MVFCSLSNSRAVELQLLEYGFGYVTASDVHRLSLQREHLKDEHNTVTTLIDAHFTIKEFLTIQHKYWEMWCSPLEPSTSARSDSASSVEHTAVSTIAHESNTATDVPPAQPTSSFGGIFRRSRGASLGMAFGFGKNHTADASHIGSPSHVGRAVSAQGSPALVVHGITSAGSSPPLSPSHLSLSPPLHASPEDLRGSRVAWLTEDFDHGSDEEFATLESLQLTPPQRELYETSWRSTWQSGPRALLRSIFDSAISCPVVVQSGVSEYSLGGGHANASVAGSSQHDRSRSTSTEVLNSHQQHNAVTAAGLAHQGGVHHGSSHHAI
jgi:hypothetical protein